jgi:excisionase family DNA binding protein
MPPEELALGEPQATYCTVRRAAQQLGVSRQLVYRMFQSGTLPGIKVEGAVRISTAGLSEYIRQHSNAPTPAEEEEPRAPQRPDRRLRPTRFRFVPPA